MKKPEFLTEDDFPDTIVIASGRCTETVPDLTRDNMDVLIREHNNLVDVIRDLIDDMEVKDGP